MNEREMDEVLRALRDEIEPQAGLRAAVMARVRSSRRAAVVRRWAGLVAAAAAVLVAIWMKPVWRVEPLPAPRLAIAGPPAIKASMPLLDHRSSVRAHRPKPRLAGRAGPITVKMLTDDPDIVIYWILEPKGD